MVLKFEQEDIISAQLKKYGLKFNPFPVKGEVSRNAPYIEMSGEVNQEIEKFVNLVTSKKTWHGLVLQGDNGTGKTRLLYLLEQQLNSQLKYANAIYAHDPQSDPIKFFSNIIFSCDFDKLILLILNQGDNKKRIFEIIDKNLIITATISGTRTAKIQNIKKIVKEINNFFEPQLNISENLRLGYSVLILYHILKEEDKYKIISDNSTFSQTDEINWFLSGEQFQSSKLDKFGIIPFTKVDKKVMSRQIFNAFLKFNHLAGKTTIFVLYDEFNYVIDNISKTRIIQVLDMIIATIEANPTGFCMVLSCLVDSWKYSKRLSPSFSERFGSAISMPQLKHEKVLELTKAYLNYGRIKEDESIDPFTEEAIDRVLTLSLYNQREFLHTNSVLLGELITEKSLDKIDVKLVNRIMKTIKTQKVLLDDFK